MVHGGSIFPDFCTRDISKLIIASPSALSSLRSRTDLHRRSSFLRLKTIVSILLAMIIPHSTRLASVKSLAGSPPRKPQDFPKDVEEELRSINNDFPLIDFDCGLSLAQSIPRSASPSVCDPGAQQHLFQPSSQTAYRTNNPGTTFSSLPSEIHDKILDYLLAPKISVSSPSATFNSSPSSWAKAPRFSRRKKVTNLTLVCQVWRNLIQSRLYRHSKFISNQDPPSQNVLLY